MRQLSSVLSLLLLVAACGAPRSPAPDRETVQTSPPIVDGPTFPKTSRLAQPGSGNRQFLSDAQLAAMFGQAFAQQSPLPEQKAVCIGLQGMGDATMRNAPGFIAAQFAAPLGLPVIAASACDMGIHPKIVATGIQAMLYTVRVERIDRGVVTFTAMATFGNVGAKGTQYRLRAMHRGAFAVEPTGLTILS